MPTSHLRKLARIDIRFALGLVLTVAAVVGVMTIVAALTKTSSVYVAATAIPSGGQLKLDALRIVDLNLGASTAQYLVPGDDIERLVTSQPIFVGELIPKSSVNSSPTPDMVNTVLTLSGVLPAAVAVGRRVDVWVSAGSTTVNGTPPKPSEVVSGAEVVRITPSSAFSSEPTSDVEFRIPRSKLPSVLDAESRDLRFTVVSVGGGQ